MDLPQTPVLLQCSSRNLAQNHLPLQWKMMDVKRQPRGNEMAHLKEQQKILINSSKTTSTSTTQVAEEAVGVTMVGSSHKSSMIQVAESSKI